MTRVELMKNIITLTRWLDLSESERESAIIGILNLHDVLDEKNAYIKRLSNRLMQAEADITDYEERLAENEAGQNTAPKQSELDVPEEAVTANVDLNKDMEERLKHVISQAKKQRETGNTYAILGQLRIPDYGDGDCHLRVALLTGDNAVAATADLREKIDKEAEKHENS